MPERNTVARHRVARDTLPRLAAALRNNWALKLLAVAFALLLWRHVVGERDAEVGVLVPIELTNIPAGTVVTGDVEHQAQVRLLGPQTLLAGLSADQVRVSVDVSEVRPGRPRAIRLSRANVMVPSGLDLVRVSPPEVVVRLDPVARRRVPVAVTFAGTPAAGHELKGWLATPAEVEVVGGAEQVGRVAAVETATIDLSGLARDVVRDVPLSAPPGGVRIEGPQSVRVQLRLDRGDS
jgi:YbbR domain-containing protein